MKPDSFKEDLAMHLWIPTHSTPPPIFLLPLHSGERRRLHPAVSLPAKTWGLSVLTRRRPCDGPPQHVSSEIKSLFPATRSLAHTLYFSLPSPLQMSCDIDIHLPHWKRCLISMISIFNLPIVVALHFKMSMHFSALNNSKSYLIIDLHFPLNNYSLP